MQLKLQNSPITAVESPCLVLPVGANGELTASGEAIDQASGGTLRRLIDQRDIAAESGKTTLLHHLPGIKAERVLLVGFGKPEKRNAAMFDNACLTAGRVLRDHPATRCHSCLHEIAIDGRSVAWRLRQSALALERGNYRYTATKPPKEDAPAPLTEATFQGNENLQAALDQAAGLAAGYAKARHWSDLPANICTPAFLAQEARALADADERITLEVLEESDMADLGMDALLAVARGSANAPKLIVLRYQGAGEDQKPVALVGKGITFDSGGLSIKSGENMMQMKYDMCGAAGVMGAFVACARLGLKINVVCVVAAVENMPDGNAYRPGDVITSMSGKTIEVLNTDAEGRLVLCDALTYVQRYEPQSIIDAATLTGACVIALGLHASALMTHDDELASELLAAGDDLADRAWRMPLWDDYQSQINSEFADMKNVGGMSAGSITAACFLERFTKGQRWAHLDTAGTAWKWKSDDGSTGRPVGLLTSYLITLSGLEPL